MGISAINGPKVTGAARFQPPSKLWAMTTDWKGPGLRAAPRPIAVPWMKKEMRFSKDYGSSIVATNGKWSDAVVLGI